jgi:transglutaminase-like putative cysteine protease
MIFDGGVQLAGLDYSVTSLDVEPGEQQLARAPAPAKDVASRYLSVPSSYGSLRSLADAVTFAAATPYAKAVALQDWLSGGDFTYSLNAPAVTNAAELANFLNNGRTGYCQQFAFAMAVLARMAGIPSRVAYGFTQGTRQRDGSWLVTTHDAHTWPELYFQGYGWLRFEPTPGGTGGQGTALAPTYTARQSAPAQTVPTPLSNPTGAASGPSGGNSQAGNRNRALLAEGDGGTAQPVLAPPGPNPWVLASLSLLGLLLVAAAVPACARTVLRRLRWRAGARGGDAALADAAWRELRDDLRDYGAGYVPSETPRALAARVTAKLELSGEAAAALRRVAMAAERARYAARPASGSTLRKDSAIVRRAIAAAAPRRTRWRARAFPASVVAPATFLLDRLTDVSGRLPSPPALPRRRRRSAA